MPRNNDSIRLYDIQQAAQRILDYTKDGPEDFFSTKMVQDAVLHNLGIIGEAASRLSENCKLTMPEIPWAQVVGLRNVLIHEYAGVDLEVVWNVIADDLPVLLRAVEQARAT